jgi:osmotically-inducible protein OsmY
MHLEQDEAAYRTDRRTVGRTVRGGPDGPREWAQGEIAGEGDIKQWSYAMLAALMQKVEVRITRIHGLCDLVNDRLFGGGLGMRKGQKHWVIAALAVFLLSGCAGLLVGGAAVGVSVAHDRRTTGTIVDDQNIVLNLYAALNQQLPPGNRINIDSYNRTVLLTGEVVSEPVRRRAEHIALNIEPPVQRVHNELAIGPPRSLSDRGSDSLLGTQVKTALFQVRIPDFDPSRVKVVSEKGVIYLLGLLRPNEADAVADAASRVGGVRQVVTLFEMID